MINKTISVIFLSASIVIMALGNQDPNSILFLFASPDRWMSAARVILAMGMVVVSFRGYLADKRLREVLRIGGCSLIGLGLASLLVTPLNNIVYNYIKLLDMMIVAEAGVIFTSCALTAPVKLPKARIKRPKSKVGLQHKTA